MAVIVSDETLMSIMEDGNNEEDEAEESLRSTFISAPGMISIPAAVGGAEAFGRTKRNLSYSDVTMDEEAVSLEPPSAKEAVRVFLRIKPKPIDGSDDDVDGTKVAKVESDYQLAFTAPRSSVAYKNSLKDGHGTLTHRFSFTKIFGAETGQFRLFQEMVLPRLEDFLHGSNQLLFAYGASSSGKTFTVQGTREDPGILPRSLDVIFNSLPPQCVMSDQDSSSDFMIVPEGFGRVALAVGPEAERLRENFKNILRMGKDLCSGSSSSSNVGEASTLPKDASVQSLNSMFPELRGRNKDATEIQGIKGIFENQAKSSQGGGGASIQFSVWVSFVEIYNENVYDLFDRLSLDSSLPRKNGRLHDDPHLAAKRVPLKLVEDRGGAVYVKGLKEVPVQTADEAVQLLTIGKENLRFAATKLNHNSSRSHCIFTVKVIRAAVSTVLRDRSEAGAGKQPTAKKPPSMATVSRFSFCDLAGSERVKKAMGSAGSSVVYGGDRQKEAGNINSSLLVLNRCIKALRHNQLTGGASHQQPQVVPYRDSKLTRLFQSYFTGHGKASMLVNISQSPMLYDESLQALKFSAIASKVTVREAHPLPFKKQPPPPPLLEDDEDDDEDEDGASKSPQTVIKKRPPPPPPERAQKQQTRFSVLMEKNRETLMTTKKRVSSILAWGNPALSSTKRIHAEDDDAVDEDNDDGEQSSLEEDKGNDTTAVGRRSSLATDRWMELVERLKESLVAEKRKNAELTARVEEVEREVRKELCEGFSKMMVEVEAGYEERLKRQKDLSREHSEWRIATLEEAYKEKRKRMRLDQDLVESELEEAESELAKAKARLEDDAKESANLLAQVEALKETHASNVEELARQREQISGLQCRLSTEQEKVAAGAEVAARLGSELEAANKALDTRDLKPKLEEQEKSIKALREALDRKNAEATELRSLLDEAGEEYLVKDMELKQLQDQTFSLKNTLKERDVLQGDQEIQLEELRHLLTEASATAEQRDAQIANLEVELEKAKTSLTELTENNDKARWMEKKAVEQQLSNLSDEVEDLKEAKKKLRAVADQQAAKLEAKEKETTALEREVKALIQAEKNQKEATENAEAETALMKKQVKELTVKLGQLDNLYKKEDSCFELLKKELELRNEEKAELNFQNEKLRADVETAVYDAQRAKADRDNLLNHYDKKLKEVTAELAVSKRECLRLRETMSKATPNKKPPITATSDSKDQEVAMLREELEKKSELVRNLASKITSPARQISDDELRQENSRLVKELANSKHEFKEKLQKQMAASQQLINEYKEQNTQLLYQIDPAKVAKLQAKGKLQHRRNQRKTIAAVVENVEGDNSVVNDPSPCFRRDAQADDDDNCSGVSTLEATQTTATPGTADRSRSNNRRGGRRRKRTGKGATTSVTSATATTTSSPRGTQVSFDDDDDNEEDSNVENCEPRTPSGCQRRRHRTKAPPEKAPEQHKRRRRRQLYGDVKDVDNEEEDDDEDDEDFVVRKPLKRGSRISSAAAFGAAKRSRSGSLQTGRTRSGHNALKENPATMNGSSILASTSITMNLSPLVEDAHVTTTTVRLSPVKGLGVAASSSSMLTTPSSRRKKLFSNSSALETFTPPEMITEETSPRTIVKWQLRSRNSRKH